MEHRNCNESNIEFAARVQSLIVKAANLPIANFDGGLFYKRGDAATECQRHRRELQAKIAFKFLINDAYNNNTDNISKKDNEKESQNEGKTNLYYRNQSYNSTDLLL